MGKGGNVTLGFKQRALETRPVIFCDGKGKEVLRVEPGKVVLNQHNEQNAVVSTVLAAPRGASVYFKLLTYFARCAQTFGKGVDDGEDARPFTFAGDRKTYADGIYICFQVGRGSNGDPDGVLSFEGDGKVYLQYANDAWCDGEGRPCDPRAAYEAFLRWVEDAYLATCPA